MEVSRRLARALRREWKWKKLELLCTDIKATDDEIMCVVAADAKFRYEVRYWGREVWVIANTRRDRNYMVKQLDENQAVQKKVLNDRDRAAVLELGPGMDGRHFIRNLGAAASSLFPPPPPCPRRTLEEEGSAISEPVILVERAGASAAGSITEQERAMLERHRQVVASGAISGGAVEALPIAYSVQGQEIHHPAEVRARNRERERALRRAGLRKR